jgi:hypothetical protein
MGPADWLVITLKTTREEMSIADVNTAATQAVKKVAKTLKRNVGNKAPSLYISTNEE